MNAFQEQCRDSIAGVLSRHELTLDFTEYPTVPPPEDGAALFLRGDLVHGSRHYKLFVYPDGAGANVGHNWYVLQLQDYSTAQALIRTFCRFLGRCLEGRHPVTALKEARR